MKIIVWAVIFSIWMGTASAQVIVYPSPVVNFSNASATYLVSVTQNGIKKKSFVYKSDIGDLNPKITGRQGKSTFNYTTFSFKGTATIEITKISSAASGAVIRPGILNIGKVKTVASKAGKTIKFTIGKPAKLSVEFNDDPTFKDVLMIFADRLEKPEDIPGAANSTYYFKANDSITDIPANTRIVYFKPGVYKLGYWIIPATISQVYIAGGAYLKGYLHRNADAPLKINGRGVLSNDDYSFHYPSAAALDAPNDYKNWYQMINLARGQNHVIEGITLVNGTGYYLSAFVNNSIIDNVNINGFKFNNDAITIGGSGNVIKNCFIRVHDDAIVPYSQNLMVDNCTFWQLSGSVFQLGWTAHSMDGINISNCFVLHDNQLATGQNLGFISAMNFGEAPSQAVIQNINVNNIYFDTPIYRFIDIRGGRNMQISGYKKGTNKADWVYKNMSFKNIHFSQEGYQYPLVYLQGLNADRPFSNIKFDGLYLNKKRLPANKLFNNALINLKNTLGVDVK